MVHTTFTFYRPGEPEHHWHGETLPAAPQIGSSVHPGGALGPDFERCWTVQNVRWVRDDQTGFWSLEVGLT